MNHTLRVAVAVLFALASATFAIGVVIERNDSTHRDEAAVGASPATNTAAEGSAEREAAERHATAPAASETTETSSENLFGVNTESAPLVIAAVVASLLLAAAAVFVRVPVVLVVVALVALGAAAFDAREIAHQLDESRNTVALFAALTLGLHLAAALAALAGLLVRSDGRSATDA